MDLAFLKIYLYVIIILSATFHEYAHSFMAYRLGDTTAKDEGRMSLNPMRHLDFIGTVIIPLFLLFTSGFFVGWAKPVPYNPLNLRDRKYGDLKVGIAGPLANLLIALILGLILRFVLTGGLNLALAMIVYINISLALFNLIPIPPLDGSKIVMNLFPLRRYAMLEMSFFGILLALFLAQFILPPLAKLIFWLLTGQTSPFA
jgi:Zn-dependent protease